MEEDKMGIESKILNNMIKFEKLDNEQMVVAYRVIENRYYEQMNDDTEIQWKGDVNYEEYG